MVTREYGFKFEQSLKAFSSRTVLEDCGPFGLLQIITTIFRHFERFWTIDHLIPVQDRFQILSGTSCRGEGKGKSNAPEADCLSPVPLPFRPSAGIQVHYFKTGEESLACGRTKVLLSHPLSYHISICILSLNSMEKLRISMENN